MKELQKEKWIGIALGIVGIAASIFILYMSFPKLSDYIEIVNPKTFEDWQDEKEPALMLIAAKIAPTDTRLIDNMEI